MRLTTSQFAEMLVELKLHVDFATGSKHKVLDFAAAVALDLGSGARAVAPVAAPVLVQNGQIALLTCSHSSCLAQDAIHTAWDVFGELAVEEQPWTKIQA